MQNSRWLGMKGWFAFTLFLLLFQGGITQPEGAEMVRKTQEALTQKGFDPGPVDGFWGPKTENALKAFQEKIGVAANGFLDRETRKRLFAADTGAAADTTAAASAPADTPSDAADEAAPAPPVEEKPESLTTAEESAPAPAAEPEKVEEPEVAKAPETAEEPVEEPVMAKEPETASEPPPAPKMKAAAQAVKISGPCPQPRKTKSAPAHIAKLDKTGGADLENGKKIYHKSAKPMACKQCHGDQGDGLGKLGKALKPKPRNFTCAETMEGVSVGQMFWIIKNGSSGTGMVGHQKTLKDKEIWDVVKYIQTTYMGGDSQASTATPAKAAESAAAPAPVKEKPAAPAAPAAKAETAAKPPAADAGALADIAAGQTAAPPSGIAGKGKYEAVPVSGGGSITGVVHFGGTVPAPIMEDLSKGKNVEFCSTHPDAQGNMRPRQKVVAADGKLRDAVVFIQNIEKGKDWPDATIDFDFKSCDIFPKVSVVRKTPKKMKTGLLTITNQDPEILHNPHGYSIVGANRKTLFNKPLPSKGDVADVTKSFKRFKPKKDKHFFLQCDQHNFMEADARVVWNPYYAISGNDGSFKIEGIPAGKYWVTAWHPYVGEVSREVTVTAGAGVPADFLLAAK